MGDVLDDLDVLLAPPGLNAGAVYGRVAPHYERFRDLWLRLAGRAAEAEMLRDLRAVLRPDERVLDAGCGTGALSREVLAIQPSARMTMLDLTPAMLARAAYIPGVRMRGDMQALPFAADVFDVVVSAWVIETVPDPRRAVAEMLRVLAPDGFLFYSFCSLPDGWVSRAGSALLRRAVLRGLGGHFLDRAEMPVHDCDRSRILRFSSGLTTFVVLRKCCTVTPDALPRPMAEVPQTLLYPIQEGEMWSPSTSTLVPWR